MTPSPFIDDRFLGATTPLLQTQWTAAFVQRLSELGWIESRTVTRIADSAGLSAWP